MSNPTAFPAKRSRAALWVALLAFAVGTAVTLLFVRYYAAYLPQAMQPIAPVAGSGGATGFVPPPERGLIAPRPDAEALAARQALLAAQLAGLETRAAVVDRDAQAAAANAGRAEGLLLAFAARRAIDRGVGLGLIEPALREHFEPTQPRAVAVVLAAGRQPVTLEDLRQGLETLAPELATALAQEGLIAALQREIAGLVVIRRAGAPSPRPLDRLARARHALDAGQVEAALAEVRRLPGAKRGAGWIAAADRYVAARQALDQLELAAVTLPIMPPMLPPPKEAPAPAAPPPAPGAR